MIVPCLCNFLAKKLLFLKKSALYSVVFWSITLLVKMVSTVDTISFVSHGVFVSFYVYSYVYFSKLMGDLFSQSSTMSKFNFIHQIFNIYFTLFLYNLITSLMNINLGIYKFYINFMVKRLRWVNWTGLFRTTPRRTKYLSHSLQRFEELWTKTRNTMNHELSGVWFEFLSMMGWWDG